MRVRFGVAMAPKGGRTAIIGLEVFEGRDSKGRLEHAYHVGSIDWVTPFTVEAARDRAAELMTLLQEHRPCLLVDVGTPQGLALHQALRGSYSPDLHRPHAYPGTGPRAALFSSFLQAYSSNRVTFEPGLPHRADLDRALIFYMSGGVSRTGVELDSEDEALVMALGLAMTWPKHGPTASKIVREET